MTEQAKASTHSSVTSFDVEEHDHASDMKTAKHSGKATALFALLLTCSLMAVVSYTAWWLWPQWQMMQQQLKQNQVSQQQLTDQLAQVVLQLNSQQLQYAEQVTQQWTSWQQQQQLQQQELTTQLQTEIATLRQQLIAQEGAPPQHWRLAEAHYLLKRANFSLTLQQDVASARFLLQQVDGKLARLDNPALAAVRQSILSDLATLNQIVLPDNSRAYLLLAQLRQQSMQLPLKQQERALHVPTAANTDVVNWRQNLAAYWQQSWRVLFQVRPVVAEDFIQLSVEQQLQLRLTLQQHLLLAEMALLQDQPLVFRHALQQAIDLLQRYFAADVVAVQQVSSSLVELSQLAVTPVALPALQSPAVMELQLSLLIKEWL